MKYTWAQFLCAGLVGFGMGVTLVALMPVNLEVEYVPVSPWIIEERLEAKEVESLDELLEEMR